jgi:creatinine amidohydrolase
MIDHAARNETSIMLALRPDLVALDRLGDDPAVWPQGVGGDDPRRATAEHGRECLATAVSLVRQKFADAGL